MSAAVVVRRSTAALLIACVATAGACRRSSTSAVVAVPWPQEEHCWWSAFRTSVPPDSVALRYAEAFASVGLTSIKSSRQADTAWAEGGPTALADSARSGTFASRVVALRRGDTTYFRTFAAHMAAGGNETGSARIAFCAAVMRAARVRGEAPQAQEPGDTLPLWRRRP